MRRFLKKLTDLFKKEDVCVRNFKLMINLDK